MVPSPSSVTGTVTVSTPSGSTLAGVFYLRNSNTPGPPDLTIAYGGPWDVPVVGRWGVGPGADTIGVYSFGNWYLRTTNTPGRPDVAFAYGIVRLHAARR